VSTNEVLFLSSTIQAIEIRVNTMHLHCVDDPTRQFTHAEVLKMTIDVRDSGPDTFIKKGQQTTLLLRRPSYDAVNYWLCVR
jgi:hypothetical protein